MPLTVMQCKDAADLVSRIGNPHLEASSLRPRQVIYRGVGNASLPLVPRAFRTGTEFPTDRGWFRVEEYTTYLFTMTGQHLALAGLPHMPAPAPLVPGFQAGLEIAALGTFWRAADEAGLDLPEDSQVTRTLLNALERGDAPSNVWPDLPLRSILALGQHYGLPTRLLDWSWDWRVAAFFAAKDNLRLAGPPERLAVWICHVGSIEISNWTQRSDMKTRLPHETFTLSLVTAPGIHNPNLRAQKGVFTLLERRGDHPLDPGTPLDALCDPDKFADSALILFKLELPTSEAPELLRLLAFDGMTAATVYPGYAGVLRSLEDRRLWAREPGPSE